jgi:hypothetical protein
MTRVDAKELVMALQAELYRPINIQGGEKVYDHCEYRNGLRKAIEIVRLFAAQDNPQTIPAKQIMELHKRWMDAGCPAGLVWEDDHAG